MRIRAGSFVLLLVLFLSSGGVSANGLFLFSRAVPDNYLNLEGRRFDPYKGPKPLVVFVQTDPDRLVFGSETPQVAIYDNGDLIVRARTTIGIRLCHRKLSHDELAGFLKRVAPIHEVKYLKPAYNVAPDTTSQPRSCFYFRDEDREVITQVYGLMLPDTELMAFTRLPGDSEPDTLPPQLNEIYEFLGSLVKKENGAEWTPRYVEVMLWPWGKHGPDEAVDWPMDWPDLKSDRALEGRDLLGDDVFYSVFLDAKLVPELRALLTDDVEAVRLDGRKWMFAIRYVYPGEPLWRKPFNQPWLDAYAEKAKKDD